MSFSLFITEQAERDMLNCAEFIRLDNPVKAKEFFQLARETFLVILETPLFYPEFRNGVRSRTLKKFTNYIIFYKFEADAVTIIRVLHTARDKESLLH